MARFLFAVFPATGHVNPGLPIARELVRLGHDVRWYSTPRFARAIESAGARFVPYRRATQIDETRLDDMFPERPRGGLKQLRWDVEKIFVGLVPAQLADIDEELRREPADVIAGDNASLVCPVAARKFQLPFVVYGAVVMTSSSRDTAPFGMALLPSSTRIGRIRNRILYWMNDRVIFRKAHSGYARLCADLQLPLTHGLFDLAKDAALYFQGTVPSFEYPRSDMPGNVRWIGATIPATPPHWRRPEWWSDLDGRQVVLVTQGTVNNDYDQLIRPTIRALAGRDVLVVATTGSQPPSSIGIDPLPSNVRVSQFVPYGQLMPRVSLLITNGGYGTVQIALAHGVPVVAFGKTEEKAEVANRVTFSGVGIGMKVLTATEKQIRDAAARVLNDPSYRTRARKIAGEMAAVRGAADAARQMGELVGEMDVEATA